MLPSPQHTHARSVSAGATYSRAVAASRDEQTSKVWVLDTHTKGTGANMVPLERVTKRGTDTVPGFALPARRPPEPSPARPKQPHRFKVIDLMTRQVLAQDVDARGALDALQGVRSIVDVIVQVWDEDRDSWRRLTFGEAKALWEHRAAPAPFAARVDG